MFWIVRTYDTALFPSVSALADPTWSRFKSPLGVDDPENLVDGEGLDVEGAVGAPNARPHRVSFAASLAEPVRGVVGFADGH